MTKTSKKMKSRFRVAGPTSSMKEWARGIAKKGDKAAQAWLNNKGVNW